MHYWAIIFGLALISLAAVGDLGEKKPDDVGAVSAVGNENPPVKTSWFKTAWIPALFGIPLMLCGMWVVLQPAARKHAMHVAAGIAALGTLLAGSRAVMSIIKLWSDDPNVNRRAALFVILMTLICAVYVVLSVRSLVQARRRSADNTAV